MDFFVEALLFLVISAVDYCLKLGLSIWLPLHTHNVVDLMSVANVSMLIFDHLTHGYYIHGRAASGKADGNAEQLKRILDGEFGNAGAKLRGLDPHDPLELQTFEIYIPATVREQYNARRAGVLKKVEVEPTQQMKEGPLSPDERKRLEDKNSTMFSTMAAARGEADTDELKKTELSMFFKQFIQDIEQQVGVAVQEPSAFQRFLSYPPSGLFELSSHGKSIFLKDWRFNFQDLSGAGLDFHMCFLRILLFWLWDKVIGNTFYGIFITYIIEQAIWWIRSIFVRDNIAKKSLVDDRFLE